MRKHTFWMQDGEIWYGNDGGEEPEGEGRLFLEALEKLAHRLNTPVPPLEYPEE